MKLRKLGNSGIEVGPLALGGNVFGWTADEPTSFAILDGFIAAGVNLIDTGDVYSVWVPGHQASYKHRKYEATRDTFRRKHSEPSPYRPFNQRALWFADHSRRGHHPH